MIKFIVCDDEKFFRDKTTECIHKLFINNNDDYQIVEYNSYNKKFDETINDGCSSKIYILDIEIKNSISGIDIARKIRKNDWNSIIILVTSHTELGYDALKAQIMLLDFISKYDNCDKSLEQTLKKAISKVSDKKVVVFESGGISHRICIDDILFVEKDTVDRKCIIKTSYSKFSVNKTMNEMINELDKKFYLTHRSCLVNTEKISHIDWKNGIITFDSNKTTDLLSRDKKRGLKEYVTVD